MNMEDCMNILDGNLRPIGYRKSNLSIVFNFILIFLDSIASTWGAFWGMYDELHLRLHMFWKRHHTLYTILEVVSGVVLIPTFIITLLSMMAAFG